MRCQGRNGVTLVFAIVLAVLLVAPGVSRAAPLGIAKFTMQPIERTNETVSEVFGEESWEFENVPYQRPFTQAGGHPWALATLIEFTKEEGETRDGEHL